jgi:hypothetical protein
MQGSFMRGRIWNRTAAGVLFAVSLCGVMAIASALPAAADVSSCPAGVGSSSAPSIVSAAQTSWLLGGPRSFNVATVVGIDKVFR